MNEIWKDIKGYEHLYQVSTLGRVKSLPKMKGFYKNKERILNEIPIQGYKVVNLSKNNTVKHHLIHRLVAETFIDNPENKLFVNHINGNKSDNRINNLEWCTRSENDSHAYKLGLRKAPTYWKGRYGENHCRSKKIKCVETGEVFKSIQEAQLKYKTNHISACLKGDRKTTAGFHWEVI